MKPSVLTSISALALTFLTAALYSSKPPNGNVDASTTTGTTVRSSDAHRERYMEIVNLDGQRNQSRETVLKRINLFQALASDAPEGVFKLECLFQIVQCKQSLSPNENLLNEWVEVVEYGFQNAPSQDEDPRFELMMSFAAINVLQQAIKADDQEKACFAATIIGKMATGDTLGMGILVLSEQQAQAKTPGATIPVALRIMLEGCNYEIPRQSRAGAALLALKLAEEGKSNVEIADRLYGLWAAEAPLGQAEGISRASFEERRMKLEARNQAPTISK